MKRIFSWVLTTLKTYSLIERVLSVVFIVVFAYAMFMLSSAVPSVSNKTYTEGLVGKVGCINPVLADLNEVDRDVSRLIFSGLVKYDPVTKDFKPDLADFTLSDDKLLYTFTVKDGVKWHDGEAFTAQDVYFTYHDVIQHEDFQNPIIKAAFDGLVIEKLNDKTVTFRLKSPNSYLISDMVTGILPYHIFKNKEVKDLTNCTDFNRNPVGAGPFKMGDYKITSDNAIKIVFDRFDDFYAQKSNISQIVFLIFANNDLLIKNIADLDAVPKAGYELSETLKVDPVMKVTSYTLPQYTGLFFNTDEMFLGKKKVRLALAKAIDQDELVAKFPGYDPVKIGIFEADLSGKFYKYDILTSGKYLDDEGFKLKKGDQYRKNKEGEELSVQLLIRKYTQNQKLDDQMTQISSYISQKWLELGVKTEVVALESGDFNDAIKAGSYGALIAGESFSYNMDLFSFWHSSQIAKREDGTGGLNFSNYSNPSTDILIESLREVSGKGKKTDRLAQIVNTFREDMPGIFLFRPMYYYISTQEFSVPELDGMVFSADRFSFLLGKF
ncbi:MAG: family 5 extracellular solute-binding protein, peptide/nickel transport system substrate-binding protein [Candidatus Peregrinibacteria bacterium GW2011_GWC2_39_14]|nr:MAG: family 5 extracellular solute-binding protein, peptide/nickel transport system substrate-binding protein [Candidatus Peregrinibacteria bacterium GW2011_GWC2_39_14]